MNLKKSWGAMAAIGFGVLVVPVPTAAQGEKPAAELNEAENRSRAEVFLATEEIAKARKMWDVEKCSKAGDSACLAKHATDKSRTVRRTVQWLTKSPHYTNRAMDGTQKRFVEIGAMLDKLPAEQRLGYLLDTIMGSGGVNIFSYPDSYRVLEAAIGHAVELLDNPDPVLSLLGSGAVVPANEKECSGGHKAARFHHLLDILKSVKNNKDSAALLTRFAKSDVSCVAVPAKSTLAWVQSGVTYPYKFRSILIEAEDVEFVPAK